MKKTAVKTSFGLFATVIMTTAFILTSCKKSELEDLKDAQICLNNSASSEARACLNKISGDTSAQAYQLRCSAVFIEEGFGNPASLIGALDQSNDAAGCAGCSSSMNILTEMAFSSNTTSTEAFNYCNASGVAVYSQLSSIVQISTLAKTLTGVSQPTTAQIETELGNMPDADLGNIVLTTVQNGCTAQGANNESLAKYCTELSGAVSSYTDPADIGACLKFKLTGDGACPP